MKYGINERFFDKWNEASAYVFGFWWADGNLYIKHRKSRSRKYAKIEFSSKDLEHLEMIANIMKWKGVIKNNNGCWNIQFSNNYIANRIMVLGGIQQKSFKFSYPKIPDRWFRHFVRGFFDGDGSIYYKNYENRHGKITTELNTTFNAGSKTGNFLNKFKFHLRKFIPVGNKKIVGQNTRKLTFGQYDSYLLCTWMYKSSPRFFLKRKKDIWDEADKEKLKKSVKFFSNKV